MPWYNTHFGIGTSSHAIASTTFQRRTSFDRTLLESLFRQCGVARKIITRMPFDATREGWDRYKGIDEELSRALRKEERRLRMGYHATQALVYEREFGGAGIVLYVDDGLESWEPLDRSRVRAITGAYTAHRWELWPHTYQGGDWARPEIYQLTRDSGWSTEYVHRSRILLFPGETSSDQARVANWSWGDPVLETVWDELRNVGVSDAGVIEYLVQLSVPFLRVKKWWELIAGKDGESKASTMLEAFRQRLSLFRLGVLDSDDSVERLNATVGGISEILIHQKEQVSAVTDYPLTVLYGRSPEGMNATGVSDLELYYGVVRARCQEDRLREPLEQWYDLIAHAPVWGGGDVTNPLPQEVREQDPDLEFKPLWVPRELEQEQVAQTRATTRNTYAMLGWIDPDEGRRLLESDGMLEPPSVDEFDPEGEEEPEEANPLAPPQEVSDAVSLGVLRARRSGQQVPTWEESVARALAGGRAVTRSQATQLRLMLQDESEHLREYFGGDVTLAWLRSLSSTGSTVPNNSQPRADAERYWGSVFTIEGPGATQAGKLLEKLGDLGNSGHGFGIALGSPDGESVGYWDGDGGQHVDEVKRLGSSIVAKVFDRDGVLKKLFGKLAALHTSTALYEGDNRSEDGPSLITWDPAKGVKLSEVREMRTDADELVPWRGRQIRVEVRAGQPRSFPGTPYPDVVMPCDYGEVVGTVGLDGDPVDVLLVRGGPDTCYVGTIVHPDNGMVDERKLVVGARDEYAAQALLVLCYGGCTTEGIAEVTTDLAALLDEGRL